MQILSAGPFCHGFSCEFVANVPLSDALLVLVEERMRQIVREKREIEILEMVPFSASEMLKSIGQHERADQVLEQEQLVRIVRIGSFADWNEGTHPAHTGEAGAFKLLEEISIEGGEIHRIFGICAPSKKELKALSQLWERFEELDHERLGADQKLWEKVENRRIWLSRGLEVRNRLAAAWRDAFLSVAEEVEGGQLELEFLSSKYPATMEMLCYDLPDQEGSRGLLDDPCPLALQVNYFLDPFDSCISFLQTIHKSLTILGFTYRVLYSGTKKKGCIVLRALEKLGWNAQEEISEGAAKLEFLVEDPLKCDWVVAEVSELKLKHLRIIFASVWIERNLALLLEKNEGNLPLRFRPEHLRVLPVSAEQEEEARKLARSFREQGISAVFEQASGRILSERVRRAERERVPFIAIVGEREIEKGLCTWRSKGRQETGEREQLYMLLRMSAGEALEN